MSTRVYCPVCAAPSTANQMSQNGCWSCAQDEEQRAGESAFKAFMSVDEETRWRLLWAAAGRPEA